jgi:hypothetical protein
MSTPDNETEPVDEDLETEQLDTVAGGKGGAPIEERLNPRAR